MKMKYIEWTTGFDKVRGCMRCFHVSSLQVNPILRDLLPFRVNSFYPLAVQEGLLSSCLLKTWQGRKPFIYEEYVKLFVCLSIKALQSDIGHESICQKLFVLLQPWNVSSRERAICDNGTNFVGYHNELGILINFWKQIYLILQIPTKLFCLASQHICFGGIWNVGDKSMKVHL